MEFYRSTLNTYDMSHMYESGVTKMRLVMLTRHGGAPPSDLLISLITVFFCHSKKKEGGPIYPYSSLNTLSQFKYNI